MKGSREYEGTEFGKTDSELGRALPSDNSCRSWSLLLERYGGKTASPTLECEQSLKVFPLSGMVTLSA